MMMNDDDEEKMFRKFLETWHTFSAPKVIILIFGVRRENFLMGLKIDFKFEILGILVQNPHMKTHGTVRTIFVVRIRNRDLYCRAVQICRVDFSL